MILFLSISLPALINKKKLLSDDYFGFLSLLFILDLSLVMIMDLKIIKLLLIIFIFQSVLINIIFFGL